MEWYETLIIGTIIFAAFVFLGRAWARNLKNAVRGECSCGCSGGCSGSGADSCSANDRGQSSETCPGADTDSCQLGASRRGDGS